MASKFAEFLEKNKIDGRRVISASRQLERLRPEDRAIRLKLRQAKKGDSEAAKEGEEKVKPRSGRPVTARLVANAREGNRVSGAAKNRVVRAVNRILEQKKKDPVTIRDLF